MQLSVGGRGNAGERGGSPGDLIVLIEEEQHKELHRDGVNVAFELHISFTDAVLEHRWKFLLLMEGQKSKFHPVRKAEKYSA